MTTAVRARCSSLSSWSSSFAVLALLATVASCGPRAPDVGDPSPLPYWVLDKGLFDAKHDWWVQRTMTKVPYDAGFTYVGDADLTDRVHFRIEEHWLIAFRSDDVWYADDDDVATAPDTTPALIYPILRHVDIVDGQQIEAPNKPWYERTHFVVDWGAEQSGTYRFSLGTVQTTGVTYWSQDLQDPDETPVFSADYVDFTSHAVVAPAEQYDPETETPGFCSPDGLGSAAFVDAVNCAPMDVAYRTSLRRIPDDDDYEPVVGEPRPDDPGTVLPPGWFDRFFRVARVNIDEQYGATFPGRSRFLSRFNLWQRSKDADGRRLPLKERAVRPVVFWVNADFPDDLKDTAQQAIDAWDVVFRATVKDARAAECVDDGGDEEACAQGAVEPDRVVVFCPNNPVKRGDDDACGKAGTSPRLGDLRYNMIAWVKQPSVGAPVGIAWWSPDLTTGETVQGVAKIYGESIDRSAAWARDAVLLATGQLSPDDVASGRYLSGYVDTLHGYSRNPFYSSLRAPTGTSPTTLPEPLPVDDFDDAASSSTNAGNDTSTTTTTPALLQFRDQAFSPIVGTPLETLALDADALIMAGLPPETTPDTSVLAAASPLRSSLRQRAEARTALERAFANAGGDLDLPVDADLGSLIDAGGGSSSDEIYAEVRRRFAFTVIAHEVGHVFALKHNFAGSYDALNYQPGYWERRDTSCIGGRYRCPLTQAEKDAHLEDYAYASIMDYHPSPNAYVHGLGHYENAAMHALYGGVAEVFSDTTLKDNEDARLILKASYARDQVAHVPLVQKPDASDPRGYRMTSYHYSRYPSVFGDLQARTFVSARSLRDDIGSGVPSSDAKGRLVVPYLSCTDVEAGDLPYCIRYDHGADPYEIVTAQTNWFRAYYPFNNFRRQRVVFEPDQYTGLIWSRVFLPVKRWNDWLIHTHFDYDENDPGAYRDPDFLEPMQVASDVGFQFLGSLLATPEPGSYFDVTMPDGSSMLERYDQPISHTEPIPDGATMTLNFPEGRIYESVAAYDAGLILINIGSAVDKELALEALLDPSFFAFPGRSTWDQTELWMLNFYNSHPDQVFDVLGSLVAGDWARLSSRYDVDDGVRYRDFNDLSSSVPGAVVDPAIGFNLRIRALVYGIGLVYSGYADRSFLQSARVVIAGSGEEEPSTTQSAVDFVDPETGRAYRAYSDLQDGVELGIAARVLQEAQQIAAVAADAASTPRQVADANFALRRQVDLIEIMRSVVQRYDDAGFTGVNPDTRRP
jgi:hypothetical protein